MQHLNRFKKHTVPAMFLLGVIVFLAVGMFFIRSYMLRQIVQERSDQIEDMIVQMRINLEYGLETHWNYLSGIENTVEEMHFSGEGELVETIAHLEKQFETDSYGSQVMLLNSEGRVYLKDGKHGIWDDINRLSDGQPYHTLVSETSNVPGTYLAFTKKLDAPLTLGEDGERITHLVLLKNIETLKKYYTTVSYGGNAATYIIKENGILAYYDAEDDIIGARNIYKALNKVEYISGGSFDAIKEKLDQEGTAVANILLDGTEYYYCLAELEEYDTTLMLLIPAEYVAISTTDMMHSTIRVLLLYMALLLAMVVLTIISIIKVQSSNQKVKIEQETNQELNRLRVAAEDALRVAEDASRSKSVFLSNMSHDIRTPMNAVIGFATLAVANVENTEKVKDYLKKILSSGNHLLSLINDILDMSRIESGRIQLEESEVNLSEVLHDIKTIVSGQIYAKQLDLYMDTMDVTDEDVYCDKMRLNQVLLNLISNAVKFTPPGGSVSVRVAQMHHAPAGMGMYKIHVKDTGIGMSREFAQKIFEPFERERTSTVSKIQGTGLGMAIAKTIIDMMGGTIEVVTEQGKGTEFIITLTLRLQEERRSIERIKELEGLKALVVDDDFNVCDSVTKMLVQVGMRSEWTMSGKEAVLRSKQSVEMNDAFHAYIIDWRLPDMNGIEVTRQIRRISGDDIPIIILTAYDWSEIEAEARAAGVTAFCSKPMFLSDLRESLLASLGQEKAKEQYGLPAAEGLEVFHNKHILLVEDNELNREIAVELLQEYGFRIDTAENGAVALEMLEHSKAGEYDLVLMDVQMPVMDGYEATRRIRSLEDPHLADITILAMTANAFEEDKREAIENGMNGFLTKPIDIGQLLEMLKIVFENK